ncbi:MAG: rhomboid family intramembrane serine protease [Candidatus Delongbacteria bacterium]|nr:rhomboid family intramembrane serine protease [Candidatus Delongbacteria bacterium]MBN2835644.1 rhomboid family intramembrane serine protease [Candidatus Delongbacteria bacterium]
MNIDKSKLFEELAIDKKTAEEWSLVLHSKAIEHKVICIGDEYFIEPDSAKSLQAAEEVLEYIEKGRLKEKSKFKFTEDEKKATIFVPVILIGFMLFFFLTQSTENYFHWGYVGKVSAFKIMQGEIWRSVTALFLHGDIAHFLSNFVVGSLTFLFLSIHIGTGITVLMFLLSGMIGNLINISFRDLHFSVGSSTAIFGMIGVMIGMQIFKEYRNKKWISVTIFLTVLAVIGTAGENTDFGAHLFGMASGLFLGLIYYFVSFNKVFVDSLKKYGILINSLIILVSWVAAFSVLY